MKPIRVPRRLLDIMVVSGIAGVVAFVGLAGSPDIDTIDAARSRTSRPVIFVPGRTVLTGSARYQTLTASITYRLALAVRDRCRNVRVVIVVRARSRRTLGRMVEYPHMCPGHPLSAKRLIPLRTNLGEHNVARIAFAVSGAGSYRRLARKVW